VLSHKNKQAWGWRQKAIPQRGNNRRRRSQDRKTGVNSKGGHVLHSHSVPPTRKMLSVATRHCQLDRSMYNRFTVFSLVYGSTLALSGSGPRSALQHSERQLPLGFPRAPQQRLLSSLSHSVILLVSCIRKRQRVRECCNLLMVGFRLMPPRTLFILRPFIAFIAPGRGRG
jgi:hypothetical protein